jgi:hypothetical protein
MLIFEDVRPFKMYKHAKSYDPIWLLFAPTSEVSMSGTLEWLKLCDQKLRRIDHIQQRDLATNFIETYYFFSKVIMGDTEGKNNGGLVSLTFILRTVGKMPVTHP